MATAMTGRWMSVALLAMLLQSGMASAIEFRLVDQREAEERPSLGQLPAGCVSDGAADSQLDFGSTSVSLRSRSWATSAGSDCDAAFQFLVSSAIDADVIGPPGTQAQICYVINGQANAQADGPNATASAAVASGILPMPEPVGIYLNAVPIVEVLETVSSNDRYQDSQRGVFTVTPGDQITLVTGARAGNFFVAQGPGVAAGDAAFRAAIYIGDCPHDRAPAASTTGLGGLAIALGGLGILALRRRSAR
jgi:hypothetical protein